MNYRSDGNEKDYTNSGDGRYPWAAKHSIRPQANGIQSGRFGKGTRYRSGMRESEGEEDIE